MPWGACNPFRMYWCNFQLCWWWRSCRLWILWVFDFKIHLVLFFTLMKLDCLETSCSQNTLCIERHLQKIPPKLQQNQSQTQPPYWTLLLNFCLPFFTSIWFSVPVCQKIWIPIKAVWKHINTQINKCKRQLNCCELMAGHLKVLYFR